MFEYAIDDNLLRRNQNTYQKGVTGLVWLKVYEKEGEKAKQEAGKLYGKSHPKDKLETINPIDSLKLSAERVGISNERMTKINLIEWIV